MPQLKQASRIGIVLTSLTALVTAQGHRTTMIQAQPDPVDRVGEASEPGVSATFGFDFATAYFFRGLRRETKGAIGQPHFEFEYDLYENDGGLHDLNLVFGAWNSLHDGPTGTRGGRPVWYENDFYLGVTAGFADNWTASTAYVIYSSPNGTFTTANELLFTASYDDSAIWGEGFGGFRPSAVFAHELKRQADFNSGSGAANNRGNYGQIGVEPRIALGPTGDLDWTLSLPAAIGFSLGDYYEHPVSGSDKPLGFLNIGAVASTDLPYVPSRFGPWKLSVSLQALFLGDATKALNSNDAVELIAGIGFSTKM